MFLVGDVNVHGIVTPKAASYTANPFLGRGRGDTYPYLILYRQGRGEGGGAIEGGQVDVKGRSDGAEKRVHRNSHGQGEHRTLRGSTSPRSVWLGTLRVK